MTMPQLAPAARGAGDSHPHEPADTTLLAYHTTVTEHFNILNVRCLAVDEGFEVSL